MEHKKLIEDQLDDCNGIDTLDGDHAETSYLLILFSAFSMDIKNALLMMQIVISMIFSMTFVQML